MAGAKGKYYKAKASEGKRLPFFLIPLSLFLLELFGLHFLLPEGEAGAFPAIFGLLWSMLLTGVLGLLPGVAARVVYGVVYFLSAVYVGFQTGYYLLFQEMLWLSDFRYASEGADYADVLLTYPVFWWVGIFLTIGQGVLILWKFPRWKSTLLKVVFSLAVMAAAVFGMTRLPPMLFEADEKIQYAGSDYGRAKSSQAVYENMFNTHRLYRLCGAYHTLAKDLYREYLYPLTPAHARARHQAEQTIETYFAQREDSGTNAMTGLLKGKHVLLVLMESMDDWMIGQHTPTLERLMGEGICFTNFYTPVYGGIRTFNSEFSVNTGSFLSSQGGYAFDYVTNAYPQSLANQLRRAGYSAKTFHYNDPAFYSRGEFSPAMGYEEYVCYSDFVTETEEKARKNLLYDDQLLFDNAGLKAEFFRQGQPNLNFVITRSAHLSYKYNEVLSYWGLKQYPQYRGLTGNEETDCAYLKAKLVDDLFARMLEELESAGQLQDTVIIGVTDHYTYGYKNLEVLYELSGTEEKLLLEKTPCFLWSSNLEAMEVDKILNTSDLLPTLLNLLGVESPYDYIGRDAFDETYPGFVPFSNGSWICEGLGYDASSGKLLSLNGESRTVTAKFQKEMASEVQKFIQINNLILDADYYGS